MSTSDEGKKGELAYMVRTSNHQLSERFIDTNTEVYELKCKEKERRRFITALEGIGKATRIY